MDSHPLCWSFPGIGFFILFETENDIGKRTILNIIAHKSHLSPPSAFAPCPVYQSLVYQTEPAFLEAMSPVSSMVIGYISRYCRLFFLHLLYWLSTHCCYTFFYLIVFTSCKHSSERNTLIQLLASYCRSSEGSSQYVGLNWFVFIHQWFVSRQVDKLSYSYERENKIIYVEMEAKVVCLRFAECSE